MKGRARIGSGGRVVIPVEYRRLLGLEPGDEVIIRLENDELRILSRAAAVRRAQAIVRLHAGEGRSLVDEMSAERRLKAENE